MLSLRKTALGPSADELFAQDMPTLLNKLRNIVLYVVLAKHDNEQSDLLHRVAEERLLEDLPNYQEVNFCYFLKIFQLHSNCGETRV